MNTPCREAGHRCRSTRFSLWGSLTVGSSHVPTWLPGWKANGAWRLPLAAPHKPNRSAAWRCIAWWPTPACLFHVPTCMAPPEDHAHVCNSTHPSITRTPFSTRYLVHFTHPPCCRSHCMPAEQGLCTPCSLLAFVHSVLPVSGLPHLAIIQLLTTSCWHSVSPKGLAGVPPLPWQARAIAPADCPPAQQASVVVATRFSCILLVAHLILYPRRESVFRKGMQHLLGRRVCAGCSVSNALQHVRRAPHRPGAAGTVRCNGLPAQITKVSHGCNQLWCPMMLGARCRRH